MRVHVESTFAANVASIWAEVQKSALLLEIIQPFAQLRPLDGPEFPERWQEGTTVRCQLVLFGVLPLGTHTLHFEQIDDDRRQIRTHEHDALVQRWDHLIEVRRRDDGRTQYSDTIEIEAGLLTPLVGLFAWLFYRHRQKRWQRVIERLSRSIAAEIAL